ncbi:hypothetical protein ACIO93_36225 [Streptomyces sp. NPDC087903]|uniref:hypothetical protein n=1 Tax=Streptomyces sp. NPDC087903 TaxID=3365819 RepID=UPI003810B6BC
MPATELTLTPHPTGNDEDLRLALEDLQLDRWLSTKTLLTRTNSWALRTSRSQVLAAAAAKGDAIAAWLTEDPTDANALMMQARVLTVRALSAYRHTADRHTLLPQIGAAHTACLEAARRWPADPAPGVCLLDLAQVDCDPGRPLHLGNWAQPPEALLPRGPWPVLNQVNKRDHPNREAYQRMLQCFQARGGGAVDFARWASSLAKPSSVLLTLPLYAFVEEYRLRTAGGQVAQTLHFWDNEQVRHYAARARDGWFAHLADTSTVSQLDLNYLAYALTACGLPGAGDVFEAIGPFATQAPWHLVSESRWWEDDFRQARHYAMKQRRPGR